MKSLVGLLSLLSLLAFTQAKPLNSRKVVYAVDCGNPNGAKSAYGFYYQPDMGFSKNTKVADYGINPEMSGATIKYTTDQQVYMTERHADESFTYEIPLQTQGKYVLILKFSELYFRQSRKRVFNIKFGDTRVVEEVDVFAQVGKNAAYDEYIEFEYKNDAVWVNGQKCHNAVYGGRLTIEFEKIGIDNPKVDGLVLFQGELAETDYFDIPTMRTEWEKRMTEETKKKEDEKNKREEAKLKRKEKVKVRNDEYEDFEDDYEDIHVAQGEGEEKNIFIKLLSNPIVLTLGIVFAGITVVNSFGSSGGSSGSAAVNVEEMLDESSEKKAAQQQKAGDKKKQKKNN